MGQERYTLPGRLDAFLVCASFALLFVNYQLLSSNVSLQQVVLLQTDVLCMLKRYFKALPGLLWQS